MKYPDSKSEFKCPSCKQPLTSNISPMLIVIHCGYGPCKSVAGDKGASGKTELEAFENLERAIEREEENNNKATK